MTSKGTDVLVVVNNTQTQPDGETEDIKIMVDGVYYKKNNKYYIIYKETDTTNLMSCSTTVKADIDKNSVLINKSGDICTNMLYNPGQMSTGVYDMKFGQLCIEIITHHVIINLSDDGGEINIRYKMDLGGHNTENDLSIKINKRNN